MSSETALVKQQQPNSNIPDKIISVQPTFQELYNGIAKEPFKPEILEKLKIDIDPQDIEIRSDGIIYLPEIKYRRALNNAFNIGGWSILCKDMQVQDIDQNKAIAFFRGALFLLGRYHAEAIGEQVYYKKNENMTYATAMEAAKSNCLVRCCKDLNIASELWDPQFIQKWKEEYAVQVWCVNQKTQDKKPLWRKKDSKPINTYPWIEQKTQSGNNDKKQSTEPTNGITKDREKIGIGLMAICNSDKKAAADMLQSFGYENRMAIKKSDDVKKVLDLIVEQFPAYDYDSALFLKTGEIKKLSDLSY